MKLEAMLQKTPGVDLAEPDHLGSARRGLAGPIFVKTRPRKGSRRPDELAPYWTGRDNDSLLDV